MGGCLVFGFRATTQHNTTQKSIKFLGFSIVHHGFRNQAVFIMGAAFGSLRTTDANDDDDDTVKWYRDDSNDEFRVGVPMAPPLPNDDATNGIPRSRVTWELEPLERHRHMIVKLDYPLLENAEGIHCSKLTIGVHGSKQVEELKWEPFNKVLADTDDPYIVIEAPLYLTMSFKIPKLRVVEAKGKWVRGRRVYQLSVYFHGPKKIGRTTSPEGSDVAA